MKSKVILSIAVFTVLTVAGILSTGTKVARADEARGLCSQVARICEAGGGWFYLDNDVNNTTRAYACGNFKTSGQMQPTLKVMNQSEIDYDPKSTEKPTNDGYWYFNGYCTVPKDDGDLLWAI